MKIKGTELAVFMETGWPGEDWYWDHDLFDECPDPDAVYDTGDLGGVFCDDEARDPTGGQGCDLAKLIRKWRKSRDFDVFTISVSKARTDEIVAALAAAGIVAKRV